MKPDKPSEPDHTATQVSVASLIDALPDALIVVDNHGIIYLANTQAEWLFGSPRVELVGSVIEDHMPERFRNNHRTLMEEYMSEPRVRPMGSGLKLFALHKTGVEIRVGISLGPIMTATGMFVIVCIRRLKGPHHDS